MRAGFSRGDDNNDGPVIYWLYILTPPRSVVVKPRSGLKQVLSHSGVPYSLIEMQAHNEIAIYDHTTDDMMKALDEFDPK